MRRLVPALFLTLLTAGCTLNTDYFSEYRGRNLLGNYGLDAVKWTLVPSPTPTDYMTWETAAAEGLAAPYTTGPDGSPAFHLEIKNLIPDGDFEAATLGPAPVSWVTVGIGSRNLTIEAAATAPTVFSSQKLVWAAGANGINTYLDLNTLGLNSSSSAWRTGNYVLKFDYTPTETSSAVFAVTDSLSTIFSGARTTSPESYSVGTSYAAELKFSIADRTTETARFWIGEPTNEANNYHVAVDNLRLIPDPGTLFVRARLAKLSSGVLPLLPGSKAGMYTFVLYVRDDPSLFAFGGTVKNRFRAQTVTISVTGMTKTGQKTYAQTFDRTAGWSGWTKISMPFGFDFVDSDADLTKDSTTYDALTISISPTNTVTGSVDAGSLLIAQPSLTFNP